MVSNEITKLAWGVWVGFAVLGTESMLDKYQLSKKKTESEQCGIILKE